MAKRTDPHRPGAIIPAEYTYVMSYALASSEGGWPMPSMGITCRLDRRITRKREDGTEEVINGEHDADGECCVVGLREVAKAKFAATGGTGKCSVCGACYIYGDVWRHDPSGEHIHIGHDCARKYSMLVDRSAHELALGRLRAATATQLIRERNAEERAAFLAQHPGLAEDFAMDHHIIRDIKARFEEYRTLSDKQVALVRKIATELRTPRVTEEHVPAPTGRVTFKGKVVAARSVESAYGTALKITVKVSTPKGSWLAWMTAPRAVLDDAGDHGGIRGCDVEITATLTAGRDPHFAFGKRPNGKVLAYGPEHKPEQCHGCRRTAAA